MEGVLEALGTAGLVILVVIGLLAGWIASTVAGGRNTGVYLVIGVLAALATPIVLVVIGLGVLVAWGLMALLTVALVGAAVVLVIAHLLLGGGRA